MDAITLTALAKNLEKLADNKRPELSVGKYEVNATVTLSVQGTVIVSEDHDYRPTTSIPYKTAMALFIRYAGITGQSAMNALTRAMSEALTLGKNAENELSELADLEAAEAVVSSGLTAMPLKTRLGAVKVKASIAEVITAGTIIGEKELV